MRNIRCSNGISHADRKAERKGIMTKLAWSLVVVFATTTAAPAQMSIKSNSGSNKWGYGSPFIALVQDWD